MSDEKTAILIRALEASGSEREAKLARAILGAAAEAPAAPEIPAAATVPAPVAAGAEQQGPQPPAGKAPLVTQADVEALSEQEFNSRYAEVEAVLGGDA